MDMSQKILAAILAGFFLIALIRVFSSPFRLALKLLLNTLLGFLALGIVRLTAGITGIALGLNLWNALVIGVLGLPGFVLLLLVQWVLSGTYSYGSIFPVVSKYRSSSRHSVPLTWNLQMVRDGGAGMDTSTSGASFTRSRTSASVSDSFQTAKQTSPSPSRAWE